MNSTKMGEVYQVGKYFMDMDENDREAFLVQFLNEEPEVFMSQISRFQGKDRQANQDKDCETNPIDTLERDRLEMIIRVCEAVIMNNYGKANTGQFISLIKKYREFTGVGLRESKAWVEENVPRRGSLEDLRAEIDAARSKIHRMNGW